MSARVRFALWLALLTLLVLALFGGVAGVLWLDLDAAQREQMRLLLAERVALFVMLALLLPFVLGGLLRWWFGAYPGAARRMAEELALIQTVNPAHRVTLAGGAEMQRLAEAINGFADVHRRLESQVKARVDEANQRLAEERNRLAALMSELAQSVLVCNAEGRILLYNPRAAQLLGADAPSTSGAPLGLGRSVYSLLERSQIVHALDRIGRRLEQQADHPVAHFVTARADQLLRVQMAPVLDAQGEVGGFVLMLEDITRSIASDTRREQLMRQLTEGSRAAIANIRAAAEMVQQYPDMDAAQRLRFTTVIHDEAAALSARLDAAAAADADTPGLLWPLEDMLAADLVSALQRNLERRLNLAAAYRDEGMPLWLSVDSHGLVQALTHVLGRVVAAFGVRSVVIEAAAMGRYVRLSLSWSGPAPQAEQLRQWQAEPYAPGSQGEGHEGGPSFDQLLLRHGAEMWSQTDRDKGLARLCLQLPSASPVQPTPPQGPLAARPVYYDFDLFSQPGQTPELDERLLAELSYTVFDTETTGLAPSEGDEIISIGAVRIVNGRLLRHECFERLIKPIKPVSRASQEIHGISPQMLDGQSGSEQVLPLFARFAEDTVLVAHNAAFDMRFLQLAQPRTGVAFEQPVLDTLMLSALAHPGHPDAEHRLERLAERLGVAVIGRHTALGDAIVTAEVFLKLVPLLAERGIYTLGQAREASQKSPYAKLEY
ncbi:MAG: 3'-5' exonuclease [Rhizobacter sp.]